MRVLLPVGVFIVVILAFSFIFWSIDYSEWPSARRAIMLYLAVVLAVVTHMIQGE